ncbi:Lrp/AsnC family transcriptional regulator [Streptomyces griseoviridis]|uniref:Lrp/AsnC family transcriptional regulator n=2 Tax=Streptomyces TaxID=1883 RepID=A0A3Q9KLA2_STRGD|nr:MULTISPECIES: Lrp/AsnC family transcriptional regulator [Streptomyces]AZS82911.1 Lrp/AsnC family transcriptional regulator [Streptomyces griseoviridis]MDH6695599.1 DNA-binding Lrp family transcriptional regulator [Streptomyces sp. MAA16]MDT0470760.1 Lrp/AsnC family transcriptional regulator [Streptomyces sp. DSM 41014]QCN90239.1 Lrp/AsnC family transcriptional regulator [Streptomyces griseoviridis]
MDLDETDLAIVRGLQADGRLTYETLARQVGLSRPAARMRVQRLQESGAVRVVAIVHPAVRRLTASAHLAIDTDGTASPVAREIATLPEAPFVTLTSGRRSIMAELRTADFAALERTIERIRALKGVRTVDPLIATRHVKDPYLLTVEPTADLQDEMDERILAELEEDGRLPFAELAVRVGLSAGATRSRTLRLLDGGVAKVVALVRPEVLGMGYLCGFSLRTDGPAAGVAEQITRLDRVTFLSTCLGRAELVGTITAESFGVVRTTLEEMRALTSVREVESWLHLEVVKEQYDLGPRAN